jgi:uncharacterized protein YndB with AHSA1/START domain
MSRIYVSTIIDAPIETVWGLIKDFNDLPKWHPAIRESELEGGTGIGCVRHFFLHDGSELREKLLALSDLEHSVTYGMVQSGMTLTNYISVLRLFPVTDAGQTFAEWGAVYDDTDLERREETAATVRLVFRSGLDNLGEMLEQGCCCDCDFCGEE